mmetsp:Transcript_33492/g.57390  ORF Transcript_33492/g.57390 Transcript_33492/m.57390 type:complete len:241 (+) Transcript_33492:498-1220(+)
MHVSAELGDLHALAVLVATGKAQSGHLQLVHTRRVHLVSVSVSLHDADSLLVGIPITVHFRRQGTVVIHLVGLTAITSRCSRSSSSGEGSVASGRNRRGGLCRETLRIKNILICRLCRTSSASSRHVVSNHRSHECSIQTGANQGLSGPEAHRTSHVSSTDLRHKHHKWVLRGGFKFLTVRILDVQHVLCVLDHHHLHAQAQAQKGDLLLTRVLGRSDHSVDPSHSEASGHQNTFDRRIL